MATFPERILNSSAVTRLKRQAKDLRDETGLTYMQALEAISRARGFTSYHTLLKHYTEHGLPPSPKAGEHLPPLPAAECSQGEPAGPAPAVPLQQL